MVLYVFRRLYHLCLWWSSYLPQAMPILSVLTVHESREPWLRNLERVKIQHTVASPFIGVITMPIGLAWVGRPQGYAWVFLLYSRRTRQGIAKAADFPSPVAVQQSISLPSRIPETSSSWFGCNPFVQAGTIFFMMSVFVSRLPGSCQRGPEDISVHS